MLREVGARLAQYALVIWIALTLNFSLPRLAPGDPLDYLFGQEVNSLTEAQKQQVLRELRLDRPVLEQYVGYFTGILRGDLGRSVRYRMPVTDVLADRVKWTLALIIPALILKAIIGTVLGALAAWRRGTARDLGLLTTMLALDSMPAFWTGMILISVFAVQLGWLPSFGAMPLGGSSDPATLAFEIGRRLILPVTTITLATVGSVFLPARASMLTTLGEDYVMMAQAKGLPERTVILKHALRNALLPVYTSLTLSLGVLASGAVVVETVFSYPGLGRVVYEGVLARDYPLLQGAFLFVTLGVVAANLLADLTYPLLDPRVRRPGERVMDAVTVNREPRGPQLTRWFSRIGWTGSYGDAVGAVGLLMLLVIAVPALLAPLIAPYNPSLQVTAPFAEPTWAHPLGGNDIGQDLVSELIYGARVSLLIGVLAAVIATTVGTTVGLVAGFFRGLTDAALMRFVDVLLALPFLPLMIVLGVYVGPGLVTEIAVIGAVIWARTAREIRSQVLSLRERSYIAAARSMGASNRYLLTRHLAPAVAPLVIPQLVRAANIAILLEASLSFLGLGDPSAKSWGTMLYYANARSAFLMDAWLWWVLPPGLCIGAVVLGFALVGYALEERARPRLRTIGGAAPTMPVSESQPAREHDKDAAWGQPPLVVEHLTVEYATPTGVLKAVNDVSLTIRRGEALGVVGESGSGKTTLVTTVLGLLRAPAQITSGRITLAGEDLSALRPSDFQRLRGKTVALVPQSAMNALNPVMSIGYQVEEAITAHRVLGRPELRARVSELLELVGIPPKRANAYPHEFSGGMRQRVVIAMALANDPDLIVADEPTTGLDLIVQAEILALLADLRARLGLSLLFISHDLPVVLRVVDNLAVMYRGEVVEQGNAREIVADPQHPYTRRLLNSVPRLHPRNDQIASPAPAAPLAGGAS